MITCYPPEGRPYDSSEYESLWAAAQDLEMPLGLHIGTNRPGPGQEFAAIDELTPAFLCNADHWVRMSLAQMIYSGVFQRYPKLQVGSVEMELSWASFPRAPRLQLQATRPRFVQEGLLEPLHWEYAAQRLFSS
jgi:predicted TIM-barrel fold metal-dependent hydrolase